jgi:hypothetical protein
MSITALAAVTIGVHLGTYHFDRNRGYNEFNPGVYVRDESWTAGAYHNSERSNSAYLAYRAATFGPVSVHVGAVTGYKRSPVSPMVVAEYAVSERMRLVWIPPSPDGNKGGLHLAAEFK